MTVKGDGPRHGFGLNPDQVDAVCQREDLADPVAANTPLGPDQAAERLGVRRVEFDHMRTLGRIKPTEWREVRFGTSRATGARTAPGLPPLAAPGDRTVQADPRSAGHLAVVTEGCFDRIDQAALMKGRSRCRG
ncbi:hypothetical protein [Streptomyces flaveus]|uniref:hypothetical protein n=1 Tax=Streptomyces flaveus TaxID=66370 RepID=UPI003D9E0AEB